jgi:polysaccharide export outer membrane protein
MGKRVLRRLFTEAPAVVVWVVAAAALGCAVPSGPVPTASLEDVVAESRPRNAAVEDLNAKLFASVQGAPEYQDYILHQGDLITVSVFEAPELNTETRIGARGFATLPLLGPVELAGRTTSEAERFIEDRYRQKYLQNPHVTIFLKEQFGGKITVLGAVEKSGSYDYPARQSLLDVLALAGGLSDKAGRMVQLRRKVENQDRPETFLIDLEQLIEEGRAELNLTVLPGDVIFVPEAGMVYVDGAVRKPGAYPIKKEMTVQEAIVQAGGLSKTADEGDIKLVRYREDGSREVVKLSLQAMRQGKASQVTVRDRDVVFVETSTLQAMVYGLRLNLGMGLVGIGYTPPPQ